MPLVILTYPGHFLLTSATIGSYIEHHGPVEITVVADDLNPYAWPTYIQDCQDLYQSAVVPVSQISQTRQYTKGWIRQQVAKLHLDQLVKHNEWFYTDGDIVFLHATDPAQTGYSVPDYTTTTQQQNDYVAQLLSIAQPGIRVNNQQVCVSDPPFRSMNSNVLQQLRQHCGDKIYQTGPGMSEWELIENFRLHVLGKELNLVKYAPHNIQNKTADLNYFTHQFLTHYGTDKDIGAEWFEKQGITASPNMWKRLKEISR